MTKKRADLLIKGGLVVTGEGIFHKDILVVDGRIDTIERGLSADAVRVIDAGGLYVLPGAIDAHAHPVYEDRMDQYSITAAYGGVTTIVPFVGNVKSWGFSGYTTDVVKAFIEESEAISYLDFGVHGAFSTADEDSLERSIPELIKMGIPSFKLFMAYKRRGMMLSDEAILKAMAAASNDGGLTMVHAETGCCIEYLTDHFVASGKTGPEWFLPSQPNLLEAEAVNRAATFAQVVGTPLYPVHLSTSEAIPVVKRFREQNLPVFTETCPHYLTLTNEELLKKGPIAKVGPPLRELKDSEEDGTKYYSEEKNFKKIEDGEEGNNLKFVHKALLMSRYQEPWLKFVFSSLKDFLKKNNVKIEEDYHDVITFTKCKYDKILDLKNHETIDSLFTYDVINWINQIDRVKPLKEFTKKDKVKIKFIYNKYQIAKREYLFKKFKDNTKLNLANIIYRFKPQHKILRNYEYVEPISYSS